MPRALTFDATGTLFHCPRLAEIYAEVLERHGVAAPVAEVERLMPVVWQEMACRVEVGRDRLTAHPGGPRGWWRRFLERLCEHLGAPPPSRFAAAELFSRFGRAEAWEVFPEVGATLAALRRLGVLLAVVSNWDDRLPPLLAELGLADQLDAVVFSAELGVEKPDPRIFQVALDRLGVAPTEALHVGDSPEEDVEGALAAGMEALLLVRAGAVSIVERRRASARGDLADLSPLPGLVAQPAAPLPL